MYSYELQTVKETKAHIQLLEIFLHSKNLMFKHVYLEQGTEKEARELSSKRHCLLSIHDNVASKRTAASLLKLCSREENIAEGTMRTSGSYNTIRCHFDC